METKVKEQIHEKRIVHALFFISSLLIVYIFVRIFYTGSTSKGFLVWNLFLAWIPLLSLLLVKKTYSKYAHIFCIFIWFIFFPNTLYLITDLKHINHTLPFLEYWLDLVILCLTSFIGIVLCVYTLDYGHKKITELVSKTIAQKIIYMSIALSGFGVYLGRFPRLNSWHIITNPSDVFYTIKESITILVIKPEYLFFIVLFTSTTFVLYRTVVYLKK